MIECLVSTALSCTEPTVALADPVSIAIQVGLLVVSTILQRLLQPSLPTVRGQRADQNVPSVSPGAPLPLVIGCYRVACTMIWTSGIEEVESSEEVGGKGGGGQTVISYTYFVTAAWSVCEGPNGQIRAIFGNKKLIFGDPDIGEILSDGTIGYDSGGVPTSDGQVDAEQTIDDAYQAAYDAKLEELNTEGLLIREAEGETRRLPPEELTNAQKIAAAEAAGDAAADRQRAELELSDPENNPRFDELERYPGSETQTPSPTIEEAEGEGEVPAYRGTAYFVLKRLALADFGNTIPTMEAIVCTPADTSITPTEFRILTHPMPGDLVENWDFIRPPGYQPNIPETVQGSPTEPDGYFWASDNFPKRGPSDWTPGVTTIKSYGELSGPYAGPGGAEDTPSTAYSRRLMFWDSGQTGLGVLFSLYVGVFNTHPMLTFYSRTRVGAAQSVAYEASRRLSAAGLGGTSVEVAYYGGDPNLGQSRRLLVSDFTQTNQATRYKRVGGAADDFAVLPWRNANQIRPALYGVPAHRYGWERLEQDLAGEGKTVGNTIWVVGEEGIDYDEIAQITDARDRGAVIAVVALGVQFSSEEVAETFAAYATPGLALYLPIGPGDLKPSPSWRSVATTQGIVDRLAELFQLPDVVDVAGDFDAPQQITVADAIRKLMNSVDFAEGEDYTVEAALSDYKMWGMGITDNVPRREALSQLLTLYPVAARESAGRVDFLDRDRPVTAFVREGDLLRRSGGHVSQSRVDIHQLPDQVQVSFQDVDRRWNPSGVQHRNLPTRTVNIERVSSFLADLPDRMRSSAIDMLRQAYVNRDAYEGELPWRYFPIEAADVISLPVRRSDGTYDDEVVRVIQADIGADFTLRLSAVAHAATARDLAVVAEAGRDVRGDDPVSGVVFAFVDAPQLTDKSETEDGAYVVFAAPSTSLRRPRAAALYFDEAYDSDGNVVFGDADIPASDASWRRITEADRFGSIGRLVSDMHSVEPDVSGYWRDEANAMIVEFVNRSASFSNISPYALSDRRKNYFYVGGEVVQATRAVQVDEFTWSFTGLWRGRRGTLPDVADHPIGTQVVHLSEETVYRAPIPARFRGKTVRLRATAGGDDLVGVEDVFEPFANRSRRLYPLDVDYVQAAGDGGCVIYVEPRNADTSQTPPEFVRWEVDVRDPSASTTVVRTLSVASGADPQWRVEYVAADVAADFGTLPDSLELTTRLIATDGRVGLPNSDVYEIAGTADDTTGDML